MYIICLRVPRIKKRTIMQIRNWRFSHDITQERGIEPVLLDHWIWRFITSSKASRRSKIRVEYLW